LKRAKKGPAPNYPKQKRAKKGPAPNYPKAKNVEKALVEKIIL